MTYILDEIYRRKLQISDSRLLTKKRRRKIKKAGFFLVLPSFLLLKIENRWFSTLEILYTEDDSENRRTVIALDTYMGTIQLG